MLENKTRDGKSQGNSQTTDETIAILTTAKTLGFESFAGKCGPAAVAINRVVFRGKGTLVAAVNKAFLDHKNVLIGHVAVLHEGIFWDADATPKEQDDIEHWGMLDFSDPDYRDSAQACGFAWTQSAADAVEVFEFDDENELFEHFDRHDLEEMIDILSACSN